MDRLAVEKIVKARGWLAHQPKAFQDAVLSRAALVSFSARDYVFHTGDDLGGVYGVVAGGFGVYGAGRESSVQLGDVLRAGRWFGHGPTMTRRGRTLTFRALEPSSVLFLPLAALDEIASRSVEFMRSVAAISYFGTAAAIAVTSDLLIRRSDQRIAATLMRVTGADEGIQPPRPEGFHLTQAELAEMANVSRDVMNRTLARFKRNGWVATSYNGIAILDAVALSEFAAGVMTHRKAKQKAARRRLSVLS